MSGRDHGLEFPWARQHVEIFSVCRNRRLREVNEIVRFRYTPRQGLAQSGLHQGCFAAFAIALRMAEKDKVRKLIDRFHNTLKVTNCGEVYSAKQFVQRVQQYAEVPLRVHTGHLNCQSVRDDLFRGKLYLVPYDRHPVNHTPVCNGGVRTHWVVLLGIIQNMEEEFFAICTHGLAENLEIWSLQELADSNSQLTASAEDIKLATGCPILKFPAGGIAGPEGLKDRAIIVHYGNVANN